MTYAQLKADVATWLDRTDLTDRIPRFISSAEEEFNREIIVPEREAVATATIEGGTLALPTDFWGAKAVYLDCDAKVPLLQVTLNQLRNDYPTDLTGVPVQYAIQGSEMVFGPEPDEDYTIFLNYYQTIPALSDVQTTNWLLRGHYNLYLTAAQWQASIFQRDWQAVSYFRGETERMAEAVIRSGRRKAHGGPLAPVRSMMSIAGVRY